MTTPSPAIEAANLQTLHSDYRALREQLSDVEERKESAEAEYERRKVELYEEWAAENAEVLTEYAEIEKAFSVKDGELRAAVIEAYAANPESKTVAPGLSVRVSSSLKYDPAHALAWAKAHDMALTLDKKAFEKIASVQKLEFVEQVETVSAVIAR